MNADGEIILAGEIDADLCDEVCAELREARGRQVTIKVGPSDGGSVQATRRIVSSIQRHADVFAVGVDDFCSAAGLVWLSAARREMEIGSRCLLHLSRYQNLHVEAATARDLEDLADQLLQSDEWILHRLTSASSMCEDDALQLLREGRLLDRPTMIRLGLLYPREV